MALNSKVANWHKRLPKIEILVPGPRGPLRHPPVICFFLSSRESQFIGRNLDRNPSLSCSNSPNRRRVCEPLDGCQGAWLGDTDFLDFAADAFVDWHFGQCFAWVLRHSKCTSNFGKLGFSNWFTTLTLIGVKQPKPFTGVLALLPKSHHGKWHWIFLELHHPGSSS